MKRHRACILVNLKNPKSPEKNPAERPSREYAEKRMEKDDKITAHNILTDFQIASFHLELII